MLKSGDHLPPVTSLAGLATLAGPRVAWLIPAGDWAACVDSALQGRPAQLEATEISICVRVSVLGVVCVGLAPPGYTCAVSVCVAGCLLYSQRVWPVPKRRMWGSTRSWTRPCWS